MSDSTKSNGQSNGHTSTSLEADIAQLSALLSQEPSQGDSDVNVAELMRRIETADGMAEGVENKLDNVLSNLDHLLASLESPESKDGDEESRTKIAK